MKKFHPFFTIGTIGTIVVASLHMLLALAFQLTSVHAAFFSLYPAFVAFLIIGVALTVKRQKQREF